jgi:hypothetical protein
VLALTSVLLKRIFFCPYYQTFVSFLAWELAVIPVGTGIGDSGVQVSLSKQGGLLESSHGKIALKIKNISIE